MVFYTVRVLVSAVMATSNSFEYNALVGLEEVEGETAIRYTPIRQHPRCSSPAIAPPAPGRVVQCPGKYVRAQPLGTPRGSNFSLNLGET